MSEVHEQDQIHYQSLKYSYAPLPYSVSFRNSFSISSIDGGETLKSSGINFDNSHVATPND